MEPTLSGYAGSKPRAKFKPDDPAFRRVADAYGDAVAECERAERAWRREIRPEEREARAAELALADLALEEASMALQDGTRHYLQHGCWPANAIGVFGEVEVSFYERDDGTIEAEVDGDVSVIGNFGAEPLTQMTGDASIEVSTTDIKKEEELMGKSKTKRKVAKKDDRHPGAQVCISIAPGIYEAFDLVRGKTGDARSGGIALALEPWIRAQAKKHGLSKAVEKWLAKMPSKLVEAKVEKAKKPKAKIKTKSKATKKPKAKKVAKTAVVAADAPQLASA